MPSFLITGGSRGLGLAFTTELLANPDNVVIATARNTAGSAGLQKLAVKYNDGRLFLVDLDVTKEDSVTNAAAKAAQLLPNGLDYLISNAGVSAQPFASFEELDLGKTIEELKFTIASPILVLRAFLPLIRKGSAKKIAILSSILSSISLAPQFAGMANTYSMSKVALNMLGRKWSSDLKDEGITIVLLHPGWVQDTDMGAEVTVWMEKNAPDFPPVPEATSAAGCMKVLQDATVEDSGEFFNYDGTKIPW